MHKYLISIGHKGYGQGTENEFMTELQANEEIAELLFKRMEAHGFNVSMVEGKRSLSETAAHIMRRSDNNTILLDIHHNSFRKTSKGAEIFVSLSNNKQLAKRMIGEIVAKGFPSRGVKTRRHNTLKYADGSPADHFAMHRLTGRASGHIIEGEFMDNETAWLAYWNRREEFVEALVKALCNYEGIPYSDNKLRKVTLKEDLTIKLKKGSHIFIDDSVNISGDIDAIEID